MDDQVAQETALPTETQTRWRNDKRAQRARARARARAPSVRVSENYIARAVAERTRREKRAGWGGIWREISFAERRMIFDVWLARTILEKQWGAKGGTAVRIARWLINTRRTHGYSEHSMRTVVYRTLGAIRTLETKPEYPKDDGPCWPPFDDG